MVVMRAARLVRIVSGQGGHSTTAIRCQPLMFCRCPFLTGRADAARRGGSAKIFDRKPQAAGKIRSSLYASRRRRGWHETPHSESGRASHDSIVLASGNPRNSPRLVIVCVGVATAPHGIYNLNVKLR
jgi:hypothetical protein